MCSGREIGSGSTAAVVRRQSSIARPSHRACAVSQVMCVETGAVLRAERFIIVRRYKYVEERLAGHGSIVGGG